MRIVLNAGHTKFGKGTGAVGLLNESIETRKIVGEMMKLLAETDHEIIPAIFDKSEDNLKEAVSKSAGADLFISVHLNAGGGHGSEIYSWKGQSSQRATKILKNLSELGFANRGVKDGSKLYVIRHTACTSLLIEVCFVDNKKDFGIYNAEKVAKAIVDAL